VCHGDTLRLIYGRTAEWRSHYFHSKLLRPYEKGQYQQFWIDFLVNVYGVEDITGFITFEDQVHIDKSKGFIDGFILKWQAL